MILARSLLRVRQIPLDDIPVADRLGALTNQLRAWQPFPMPRLWVQVFEGHALAYACDAAALPESVGPEMICWPEPALHAAGEDGLRLVRSLQGVEGQCWKSGRLEHSRWWADAPTPIEWLAFARASGQAAAAGPVPPVQELPWQAPSPRLQVLDQLSDTRTEALRMLGLLTVFGLIGFGAFVGHEMLQAHDARDQASLAFTALEQEAAPARAAQDRALRSRAELEAIARSLQAVQPLEVVDHLARGLQRGVVIKELELQGLELRLVLEAPAELSRSDLIEALEAGGWLSGVAEQKDVGNRALISLQARLKGVRPPAVVQAQGGVSRSAADGAPAVAKAAAPNALPAPTIPPELLKGRP